MRSYEVDGIFKIFMWPDTFSSLPMSVVRWYRVPAGFSAFQIAYFLAARHVVSPLTAVSLTRSTMGKATKNPLFLRQKRHFGRWIVSKDCLQGRFLGHPFPPILKFSLPKWNSQYEGMIQIPWKSQVTVGTRYVVFDQPQKPINTTQFENGLSVK